MSLAQPRQLRRDWPDSPYLFVTERGPNRELIGWKTPGYFDPR